MKKIYALAAVALMAMSANAQNGAPLYATGAGDSMVAGFLSALDKGMDYQDALSFAVACGSATAASQGLANRQTIERFFSAMKTAKKEEAQKEGKEPLNTEE